MLQLRYFTRGSFRTYILFLCVMYLFLVYLFHARLQPSYSNVDDADGDPQRMGNDGKYPEINVRPEDVPADTGVRARLKINNATLLSKYAVQLSDKNNHRKSLRDIHVEMHKNSSHIDRDDKKRGLHDGNCVGAKAEEKNVFLEITKDMLIYSAYWDKRHNDFDNKDNNTMIRVMVVAQRQFRPPLECVFSREDGGEEERARMTYYEMCENHNRPYGGYILSCVVPRQVAAQGRLCSVRIGAKNILGVMHSVRVAVQPLQNRKENRHRFGICVPPLFGQVPAIDLVEFIEVSKTLGVEHITFYNFQIHPVSKKVLDFYVAKGMATVVSWPLPKHVDGNIWYHGQLIAVQDCLYRNMRSADFLAFNDIDEFIVPQQHPTWEGMVTSLHDNKHCGYQFNSAFFDRSKQAASSQELSSKYSYLKTIKVTTRSQTLSRIRTKCMVKPQRIFEKGIHHISKPILANLVSSRVHESDAILHHYRSCLANFGMSCSRFTRDTKLALKTHKVVDIIAEMLKILEFPPKPDQ